ncbi:MAG: homoserine dehydrogenase [Acidimicrobiales bacterium]
MHPIRLGVLGCGNVGAAFVDLVAQRRVDIASRLDLDITVEAVAVRSLARERAVTVGADVLTADPRAVVTSPDVDVVVELMGGVEPARELVATALKAGKPVVTANKELLANHGAELYAEAADAGVDLLFEAAVGGAIPLVRALRNSLAGEPVERMMGIVNGTTNFILSRMTESGSAYAEALAEAQTLGFAERDPTADVEGHDAAAKAAIMATVAFGGVVVAGDVHAEGISGVDAVDISMAARLGHVIKLLAIVERSEGDPPEVSVRVHPSMVPVDHPLASVRESFNAVFVEGGAAGELMFYGRGAGGLPTASAVLGDVVDAARNLRAGTSRGLGRLHRAKVRSIDESVSPYYIRMTVKDRPGVLATVAGVFGDHAVSIRSMEQDEVDENGARLVFITHSALERDIQATLAQLRETDGVVSVGSLVRVVGGD